MATWRDNTLAKSLATLAGTTALRVIHDPSGTPTSLRTTLDAIKTWMNVRDKLTANRTYYVATTGSDNNDGLTPGTPFLTPQKAVDTAATVDLAGNTITVQIANGTYTGSITAKALVGGNLILLGDETTPANVVLQVTATTANIFTTAVPTSYALRGVKLVASGTTNFGISADLDASVTFQNVDFGGFPTGGGGRHILTNGAAVVRATGPYTISGSVGYHVYLSAASTLLTPNQTVTITGTPAWGTRFAYATNHANYICNAMTFSGSATGVRYVADHHGLINTSGGGASYLPGNSAGSVSDYGLYK